MKKSQFDLTKQDKYRRVFHTPSQTLTLKRPYHRGHIFDMGIGSLEMSMANAFLLNGRVQLVKVLGLPSGRLVVEGMKESIYIFCQDAGREFLENMAEDSELLTPQEIAWFLTQMKDAGLPENVTAIYKVVRKHKLPAGFKSRFSYSVCSKASHPLEHGVIVFDGIKPVRRVISKSNFFIDMVQAVHLGRMEPDDAIHLLKVVGSRDIPEVHLDEEEEEGDEPAENPFIRLFVLGMN